MLEYLTIFGLPVVILCLAPFLGNRGPGADLPPVSRWYWVGAIGSAVILGVVLQAPVLMLAVIAVAWSGLELYRQPAIGARTVVLGLVCAGAGLSGIVEIFYIRDVFESRMNTLFKVYYQVWVLFALAAAVTLALSWQAWWPKAALKPVLAVMVSIGLVLGLAYPVVATWQWTDHFADRQSLDGLAYARERYPDEAAAITWLQENVRPGQSIVEAAGCSYLPNTDLPFDRFSAYTGAPTVIGWGHSHEIQWRRGQPALLAEIDQRAAAVADIYADPDGSADNTYHPDWLIVGRYERGDWQSLCPVAGPYAGIDGPGWPGTGWREAFRAGDVVIYQRVNG